MIIDWIFLDYKTNWGHSDLIDFSHEDLHHCTSLRLIKIIESWGTVWPNQKIIIKILGAHNAITICIGFSISDGNEFANIDPYPMYTIENIELLVIGIHVIGQIMCFLNKIGSITNIFGDSLSHMSCVTEVHKSLD